jgi:D-tyrosyl-tRNA(Tyr) deacylase
MRAVIQRVNRAKVSVAGSVVGEIKKGLLVLLAVHKDDEEEAIKKLADKLIKLRIFADSNDKMNLSIKDAKGEILVVSQFTLYGDASKGNRPSFINSAQGDKAVQFYEKFVSYIGSQGIKAATGQFGTYMDVELINDGPVTIILDI